ncbi:MAG: peroxiredoxin [Christensenellaceae bacterium]|nr:peroxiredoxin [Christensenellaceae bacterium]
MEMMTRMPLLGDKFPEMTVRTTQGVKNLPGDYAGKWFILFSHPGDFTPVCTTEFVAFNKRFDEFRNEGAELLGLSVDQLQSHLKWTEWIENNANEKIKFPIIADEMGLVAQQLGMIHPGKGTNTVRAVFIVDPNGVMRTILYFPQEIGRSVNEIMRAFKALKYADEHKVACPENFPNNEWLGQGTVIIPPAATEAQIEERKAQVERGEIECLDWWLCYKKQK